MALATLKQAFTTDVSTILAVAREREGGAIDPVAAYRASGYRRRKADERPAQAVAAGRFASLSEARRHVASNVRPKTFGPRGAHAGAARGYERVESRYLAGSGETI